MVQCLKSLYISGLTHFTGHLRFLNWRYLPYIRPIFQAYVREYPQKIWPYMVLTYLHFRILKFPLIMVKIFTRSRRSWKRSCKRRNATHFFDWDHHGALGLLRGYGSIDVWIGDADPPQIARFFWWILSSHVQLWRNRCCFVAEIHKFAQFFFGSVTNVSNKPGYVHNSELMVRLI